MESILSSLVPSSADYMTPELESPSSSKGRDVSEKSFTVMEVPVPFRGGLSSLSAIEDGPCAAPIKRRSSISDFFGPQIKEQSEVALEVSVESGNFGAHAQAQYLPTEA